MDDRSLIHDCPHARGTSMLEPLPFEQCHPNFQVGLLRMMVLIGPFLKRIHVIVYFFNAYGS